MSPVLEQNSSLEINLILSKFSKLLHAYLECTDTVQHIIREMIEIVNDTDATDDEISDAISTIKECLFPSIHDGVPGVDLEDSETATETEEGRLLTDELNREELIFAKKVTALMKSQGITQAQLAEKIGVQQPAVSMLLNRTCRPQHRTIEKIAAALGVSSDEIWTAK